MTDPNSTSTQPSGSALKEWLAKVRPKFVALLVLLIFQVYLITSSDGFYYIDEGAHFMDDFAALTRPSVSIGVWQRFGSVWFFTLPAQLGHVGVMVFASIVFLLTIFIAYKVAELEHLPYKEWLIVLAGFQPVFLDISFTCLAEVPAALFLILAYYLYRTSRWKLSLTVASAVFLCRYEMSILAVLIFLAAIRHRKYSALPFAIIGPALWYVSSLLFTGDPGWLLREFVKFGSLPKFIQGTTWYHYFQHSFSIFGVIQVLLAIVSLLFALSRRRVRFAIPLLTILWCFAFNTIASAEQFHWSPSVGDFRYLATVAPFVALFSLDGLSNIMDLSGRIPFSKVIPPLLAIIMIFNAVSFVRPHRISPYEVAVMTATRKAAEDSSDAPILSNHWASRYALMSRGSEMKRLRGLTRLNYLEYPREYVVWDSQIANSMFSQQALTLEDVRKDSAVRLVEAIDLGYDSVSLYLRDIGRIGKPTPTGSP